MRARAWCVRACLLVCGASGFPVWPHGMHHPRLKIHGTQLALSLPMFLLFRNRASERGYACDARRARAHGRVRVNACVLLCMRAVVRARVLLYLRTVVRACCCTVVLCMLCVLCVLVRACACLCVRACVRACLDKSIGVGAVLREEHEDACVRECARVHACMGQACTSVCEHAGAHVRARTSSVTCTRVHSCAWVRGYRAQVRRGSCWAL